MMIITITATDSPFVTEREGFIKMKYYSINTMDRLKDYSFEVCYVLINPSHAPILPNHSSCPLMVTVRCYIRKTSNLLSQIDLITFCAKIRS